MLVFLSLVYLRLHTGYFGIYVVLFDIKGRNSVSLSYSLSPEVYYAH